MSRVDRYRLCHPEQAYTIHLHAKLSQCSIQGRRARDDAHAQSESLFHHETRTDIQLFGTGCIPWSPLSRGFLARPWQAEETLRVKTDTNYKGRGTHLPDKSRQTINERVEELATNKGVTMAQIGLAWSLGSEHVTAPIVGTTKLENLKELIGGCSDCVVMLKSGFLILAALDIELSPEERKYIDEPYEPRTIVCLLQLVGPC